MRRPERIPIFLKKINWTELNKRWKIEKDEYQLEDLPHDPTVYTHVCSYWKSNPDQRFGQVLINLGIINDSMLRWTDEENDILMSQDVPPREYLLWGQNYDKNMNLLPKTIWKTISELNTEHIKAILDGNYCNSERYLNAFKNELEIRQA